MAQDDDDEVEEVTAAAAEPIEVGMSDEDSPETAPSRRADDFPAGRGRGRGRGRRPRSWARPRPWSCARPAALRRRRRCLR